MCVRGVGVGTGVRVWVGVSLFCRLQSFGGLEICVGQIFEDDWCDSE